MDWIKKHNIPLRILAVFIAILIWFFVVSELNPDMDSRFRNIDIQITDIDQLTNNGLAIVSGGNETADLKVRGKRDKIGYLKAENFKLSASVSSISVPGTYNLTYTVDIDSSDVSLVSKSPSQVTVVVDRVSAKTVPAEMKLIGQLPSGYLLDSFNLSPDAIIVKGPQSQLEKIEKALLSFNLKNVNSPLETTLSYKLVDSKGNSVDMDDLTVDTPAIVMSADIKRVKTVPFKIDYISEGIFSEDIISASLSVPNVTLVGDIASVNSINHILLSSINLKSFITEKRGSITYDIVLPNGVTAQTPVDNTVLTIETPDHMFKKIVLSATMFEQPIDHSYLSGTGISIEVFGSENIVGKLTSEDFTVSIDHIKGDDNGVTAIAALNISCRFPDIYVIGSYTVPVTVNEVPPVDIPVES